MARIVFLLSAIVLSLAPIAAADDVFVEAEAFANPGGWTLDTQFIQEMGSPYLLAHGLGKPVADAVTEVQIPASGEYRVWVRTKDWVARWQAKGTPGRFKVSIGGQTASSEFGTENARWAWQDGGTLQLQKGKKRNSVD